MSAVTLEIATVEGNLLNVDAPLYALGVFEEIEPTAAFRTVDLYLDGRLAESYRAGRIDGRPGRLTPFHTREDPLRADRVCLVGMGPSWRPRPRDLASAGEAVAAFALAEGVEAIATVPLGLGSGLGVEAVVAYYVRALVRAVAEAGEGAAVRRLVFADFDGANCDALRREIARRHANGAFPGARLAITGTRVARAAATAPDHPIGSGDKTYLKVSMRIERGKDGGDEALIDTLVIRPTGAAMIASHARRVPFAALEAVVERVTGAPVIDPALGRDLARHVLTEAAMAEILEAQGSPHALVVLHDGAASAIPWEALAIGELAGVATKVPVSRLLAGGPTRTPLHRRPRPGDRLNVLLVADPTGDLPGARREGEALEGLFGARPFADVTVASARARRAHLLATLAEGAFDVLHYAGHAFFDPAAPELSGLVFADGVLTATDVAGLTRLPRLVVFNACEGAWIQRADGGAQHKVADGAAIATAFLEGGVQHFVSTTWPVGDRAASAFSSAFYARALDGIEIGHAAMYGRQAVARASRKDWANYVHFGDPSSRIRPPPRRAEPGTTG